MAAYTATAGERRQSWRPATPLWRTGASTRVRDRRGGGPSDLRRDPQPSAAGARSAPVGVVDRRLHPCARLVRPVHARDASSTPILTERRKLPLDKTSSRHYKCEQDAVHDLVSTTTLPGSESTMPNTSHARDAIEFVELVCTDRAWLRAEFDAIIGANFDGLPPCFPPPRFPRPLPAAAGPRRAGRAAPDRRTAAARSAEVAWSVRGGGRQRSPPPPDAVGAHEHAPMQGNAGWKQPSGNGRQVMRRPRA